MSGKAGKARKHRLAQLEQLTQQQLVALAVQKEALPYIIAKEQTRAFLVESLVMIEDVLKPVPA